MTSPDPRADFDERRLRSLRRTAREAANSYVGRHWPSMEAMRRDGIGYALVENREKDPAIRRFIATFSPEFVTTILAAMTSPDPREREEPRPMDPLDESLARRARRKAALDQPAVPVAGAEDMETCPTCWQPVPRPQRGDHDYGIPLRAAQPEDDGLDAAWKEAEAALPEGWIICRLIGSHPGPYTQPWQAQAEPTPAYKSVPAHFGGRNGSMWLGKGAHGDTPAAALMALAQKLREPSA